MKSRPYNLILLSAEREACTTEYNDLATQQLGALLYLLKLKHGPAQGRYEGRLENSYAVKLFPPLDDHLPMIRGIAFKVFHQDSILLVDTQDQAHLIFSDGKEEFIGKWAEVTLDGSLPTGDWSKIGDRYFTVQ